MRRRTFAAAAALVVAVSGAAAQTPGERGLAPLKRMRGALGSGTATPSS